jgi:hypothetical protein
LVKKTWSTASADAQPAIVSFALQLGAIQIAADHRLLFHLVFFPVLGLGGQDAAIRV